MTHYPLRRSIAGFWATFSLHPAINLVIVSVFVVGVSALANRGVSAQTCMGNTAYWCAGADNNPCPYDDCEIVNNTCDGGTVTTVWAWVNGLTKPPHWPRCTGPRLSSGPMSSCGEAPVSCGTTQHYMDGACSMPCDVDVPGQWYGCQASGTPCN